jgi:outer membrane autotransporter protein
MRTLALTIVIGMAFPAAWACAQSEVKMNGDARVDATMFAQRGFTGNAAGASSQDKNMTVWQRYRLKTDFVADENVKFRLGVRVNNAFGEQQRR